MASRRCYEHRPSQSGFGDDFYAVGGDNSFHFTRNFWLVAGPRRLAYSAPHVDGPDLQRRVVKLRCEEAEAAMDVVGEVLLVIGGGLVLCSSLIWLWSLRPKREPWHGQDVPESVNKNE